MDSRNLKLEFEMADQEDGLVYDPPGISNNSREYKNLPSLKEEKPYIGPENEMGKIQVLYPRAIDGYEVDYDRLKRMESLGLPTGFSFAKLSNQKKPKKTFYCNVCLIELNSEDTAISHMKGVKHMKKELAIQTKLMKTGQPMPNIIIPIKNPEATRKKIPIRLLEKIQESSNPVVGLDYISEFIPVSDSEMEPHYECSLCESQGQANGMFSHLMGHRHRQQFTNKLYGDNPRTVKLSQAELLDIAYENDENKAGFTDRIKTIYSDEEYPWLPGKEPWNPLNGGSGIVPDRARMNYGKNGSLANAQLSLVGVKGEVDRKSRFEPVVQDQIRNNVAKKITLPNLALIGPPSSMAESERMLCLGKQLIMLAADYSGLKHADQSVLRSLFAALALKLKSSGKGDASSIRDRVSAETSRKRTWSRTSGGSSNSSYGGVDGYASAKRSRQNGSRSPVERRDFNRNDEQDVYAENYKPVKKEFREEEPNGRRNKYSGNHCLDPRLEYRRGEVLNNRRSKNESFERNVRDAENHSHPRKAPGTDRYDPMSLFKSRRAESRSSMTEFGRGVEGYRVRNYITGN